MSGRGYWKPIVSRFERSGLTHDEFCEREDLSVGTFRSWLYRIRAEKPAARFVEVEDVQGTASACVIRAHGVEIELSARPGASYIAELISAVATKR